MFVQHLAEFSGLDTTTLFRLYALHRSVPFALPTLTQSDTHLAWEHKAGWFGADLGRAVYVLQRECRALLVATTGVAAEVQSDRDYSVRTISLTHTAATN